MLWKLLRKKSNIHSYFRLKNIGYITYIKMSLPKSMPRTVTRISRKIFLTVVPFLGFSTTRGEEGGRGGW